MNSNMERIHSQLSPAPLLLSHRHIRAHPSIHPSILTSIPTMIPCGAHRLKLQLTCVSSSSSSSSAKSKSVAAPNSAAAAAPSESESDSHSAAAVSVSMQVPNSKQLPSTDANTHSHTYSSLKRKFVSTVDSTSSSTPVLPLLELPQLPLIEAPHPHPHPQPIQVAIHSRESQSHDSHMHQPPCMNLRDETLIATDHSNVSSDCSPMSAATGIGIDIGNGTAAERDDASEKKRIITSEHTPLSDTWIPSMYRTISNGEEERCVKPKLHHDSDSDPDPDLHHGTVIMSRDERPDMDKDIVVLQGSDTILHSLPSAEILPTAVSTVVDECGVTNDATISQLTSDCSVLLLPRTAIDSALSLNSTANDIHASSTDTSSTDDGAMDETVLVFKNVKECMNASRTPVRLSISNLTESDTLSCSSAREDLDSHDNTNSLLDSSLLKSSTNAEAHQSAEIPRAFGSASSSDFLVASVNSNVNQSTGLHTAEVSTASATQPVQNDQDSQICAPEGSPQAVVTVNINSMCQHPICLTCEGRLDSLRSTNSSIVKPWNDGAEQLARNKKHAQIVQQQLQEVKQCQLNQSQQLHQYQLKINQYEEDASSHQSSLSTLNETINQLKSSLDASASDNKHLEHQLKDIQRKYESQSNLYKRFQSDFTRVQASLESEISLQQQAAEQAKENLHKQQAEVKLSIEAATKIAQQTQQTAVVAEEKQKLLQSQLDELQLQHAEVLKSSLHVQSQLQAKDTQIQSLTDEIQNMVRDAEVRQESFELRQRMHDDEWKSSMSATEEARNLQQKQLIEDHATQIGLLNSTIEQLSTELQTSRTRIRELSKADCVPDSARKSLALGHTSVPGNRKTIPDQNFKPLPIPHKTVPNAIALERNLLTSISPSQSKIISVVSGRNDDLLR